MRWITKKVLNPDTLEFEYVLEPVFENCDECIQWHEEHKKRPRCKALLEC